MGEIGPFQRDQGSASQGTDPQPGAAWVSPSDQPGTWPPGTWPPGTWPPRTGPHPANIPAPAEAPQAPYTPPPPGTGYPPPHVGTNPAQYGHAPYGPPPPYAAGYPPPYAPYPQPMWGPPAPLAEWWQRAVAALVDGGLMFLIMLPGLALFYGSFISIWLAGIRAAVYEQAPPDFPTWSPVAMALGFVYRSLGTAAGFWYFGWRQGLTGQTFGKRLMRIRLIGMDDGRPIGGQRGLGRYGLRFVIAMASVAIVSYLWPLWDAKRQTWEDMALKSVVVSDDQRA